MKYFILISILAISCNNRPAPSSGLDLIGKAYVDSVLPEKIDTNFVVYNKQSFKLEVYKSATDGRIYVYKAGDSRQYDIEKLISFYKKRHKK